MATVIKCMTCDGCGKVANDDEGTPWTYWAELPPGADIAVRLGIVKPQTCPACGGDGVFDDAPDDEPAGEKGAE